MMSAISPKYDKYPRNLLTTHQIAIRNYNRLKEVYDAVLFEKRIDESMEWSKEHYKFIYPKSIQDIKDEAVQQNNCVSSYIKRVIDGKCHIVFMRHTGDVDRSLITLEVVDNRVVQQKGQFNRDTTAEEGRIIEKYNEYLQKRDV